MEKTKIGIGVIGTGWMASAHIHAYKTMRYRGWDSQAFDPVLRIIGGSSLEKAERAREQYGFARACSGWEEVVAAPDVDVVDNVTPDRLHVEPSIEAAKNGKHIFCEKPLAVDPEEARRMWDAVRAAGVKSGCGFSYRFFPAVRLAYDLIREGAIGRVLHFSSKYFQDQGSTGREPAEDVWYLNWSGIGQGITSHMIDMSRFLVGEPKSVRGMISTYHRTRATKSGGTVDCMADEGFFALVEFDNGASGVYESLGVANGVRNQFSIEIYGTNGSLRWDVADPNFLLVYQNDASDPRVRGFTRINATEPVHPLTEMSHPTGHGIGWEMGHVNMLAHFLDCVKNDRDVAPLGGTFEDGYRVARIIDSINRSSLDGARIDL